MHLSLFLSPIITTFYFLVFLTAFPHTQVLDQLRNQRVRNNQLEELVKSLESEIENQKSDMIRLAEEQQGLNSEKEQLEVEISELSSRMAVRDTIHFLHFMIHHFPVSSIPERSHRSTQRRASVTAVLEFYKTKNCPSHSVLTHRL